MAINPAFLGHGIFTEMSVTKAINRYASYVSPDPNAPAPADNIDRFINALRDMHVSYVWIHLFSRGVDKEAHGGDPQLRVKLIKRLRKSNIPWAGWGYCAGATRDDDLALIKQFKDDEDIAMKAFVVNSEPELNKDEWPDDSFETFMTAVEGAFSKDDIAVSTWPVLYQHEDDHAHTLMQIAAPHVCAFAPQVYWLNKPISSNYDHDHTEHDYPKHDPIAYVRLCLDDWTKYLNKWKHLDPSITAGLIVSGQTYWGEDGSPSLATMEQKLRNVVTNLPSNQWARMIGFNWYHAGKPSSDEIGSMSAQMITDIAAAKLHLKPYQHP